MISHILSASSLDGAIDAHRQASAAFEAIGVARGKMVGNEPGYVELTAKWELANEAEEAAAITLCAYPCQTIEEARAKAEYISGSILVRDGLTAEQIEVLLGSFSRGNSGAGSISELGAGSNRPRHPDAELIALGAELKPALERLVAAMSDSPEGASEAYWHALMDPGKELAEHIEAMSAHTLEGLSVKALAILWCHTGEFEGFGLGATDERLMGSIVRDLLTLSNVSETAK
jgi:hypothetical protein